MIPTHDPGQGPKLKLFISLFFVALAIGCGNLPEPAAVRADRQQERADSLQADTRRFMAWNDSVRVNLAKGYASMASGNKDSALMYMGKARAYSEMMHTQVQ